MQISMPQIQCMILMEMLKHSQSSQIKKFAMSLQYLKKEVKILKVTSLQYLYNISKKKLGMEVIFDMQINVKVSTSWYYPF